MVRHELFYRILKAMKRLKKKLRKLNRPLPPILLQNQFAQHIKSIEAQKQYAQASLKNPPIFLIAYYKKPFLKVS